MEDENKVEKITVCVRFRPLNEQEQDGQVPWTAHEEHKLVELAHQTRPGKYHFDHVFGHGSGTEQLYDRVASRVVHGTLRGVSGTIFAYGQTSSGKTFTMDGVVAQAVKDLFAHIEADDTRLYRLKASCVEIYNDRLRDLLDADKTSQEGKRELQIRQSRRGDVSVQGLREVVVRSPSELLQLVSSASKNRVVCSTSMNDRSSRSHQVLRLTIHSEPVVDGSPDHSPSTGQKRVCLGDSMNTRHAGRKRPRSEPAAGNDHENADSQQDQSVYTATLNLVDLAGSERVSNTGAVGEQVKQAGQINKSLSVLARVIHALSANAGDKSQGREDSKQQTIHVPFRDSKLTRILQPALGGANRAVLVCCATLSARHVEITRSTLEFAQRAKRIENRVRVNASTNAAQMIRKLRAEVSKWKAACEAGGGGAVCVEGQCEHQQRCVALKEKHKTTKVKFRELADSLRANIKELQDKLDNEHSTQERLDIATFQRTEAEQHLEKARSELEDMRGVLQEREQENSELYRQMAEEREERRQVRAERDLLEDKVRELTGNAEKLSEMEAQTSALQATTDELQEKSSELQAATSQLEAVNLQLSQALQRNAELREQVEKMGVEADGLRGQVAQLSEAAAATAAQHSQLQTTLAQHATAHQHLREEVELLNAQNEALTQELEELVEQSETAMAEAGRLAGVNASLHTQLQTLASQLQDATAAYTVERALRAASQEHSVQLAARIHKQMDQHSHTERSLRRELATARASHEALQNDLSRERAAQAASSQEHDTLAQGRQRLWEEKEGLLAEIEAQRQTIRELRSRVPSKRTLKRMLQEAERRVAAKYKAQHALKKKSVLGVSQKENIMPVPSEKDTSSAPEKVTSVQKALTTMHHPGSTPVVSEGSEETVENHTAPRRSGRRRTFKMPDIVLQAIGKKQ